MSRSLFRAASGLAVPVALNALPAAADDKPIESVEALGRALFFDVNLSNNRTQACATCHDPEHGFVDPRETTASKALSQEKDHARSKQMPSDL